MSYLFRRSRNTFSAICSGFSATPALTLSRVTGIGIGSDKIVSTSTGSRWILTINAPLFLILREVIFLCGQNT